MRFSPALTLAIAALAAAPADAAGPRDVAPDGRAAAYSTFQPAHPDDLDTNGDVFSWNRGAFDFASRGPGGDVSGASMPFVSDDGTRVLFTTWDPLLAADTDGAEDVYERVGGVTSLVSTGPSDNGADRAARFGAASNDGTRVYFDTEARLVPEDTDDLRDVYLRTADGTVTLASTTPAGVPDQAHLLVAASRNGLRMVEVTDAPLTSGDNPGADLFERFDGTITHVSKSLVGPVALGPGFAIHGVTPDARSVVIATFARMTGGDRNSDLDLYQFSRGRTTLVTSRSDGVSPRCDEIASPLVPSRRPPCEPFFASQTDDGDRVLFTSSKGLAAKPGPLGLPVTAPAGGLMEKGVATGATRLIDEGGRDTSAIAPDGARYLLHTATAHSPEDTDDFDDLYLLEGGQTTLLSGTGGRVGVSDVTHTPDLRRVFFESIERLAAEDTNSDHDTYVNTPDGPRLAMRSPSVDPVGGYGRLLGPSESGDRWLFLTPWPLAPDDSGTDEDLYVRHTDGTTRKLSP